MFEPPAQPGVSCWPPSGVQGAQGCALFVKGLSKGCTSNHLHAIFTQFGTVVDCQIARHRSGRSAGFAIVTFLRNEEAVTAMQAVDGLVLMGRRLSIRWFSPERALEGGAGNMDALGQQQALSVMQALQHLPPAELMAQLAQLLDPKPVLQPTAYTAHWLAQHDAAMVPQEAAAPGPVAPGASLNFLSNLSALSLADTQHPSAVPPFGVGLSSSPTTPTSDVPDGAVFVTAGPMPACGDKGGLATSRLSKWCNGSPPGSVADDASSETASLHASDDSSVATTVRLAKISCDSNPSSGEGCSPAALSAGLSTEGRSTIGGLECSNTMCATSTTSPALDPEETNVPNRNLLGMAPCAASSAAASRPSVLSDPGAQQQQQCPFPRQAGVPNCGLSGMPAVAPLRIPHPQQPSLQGMSPTLAAMAAAGRLPPKPVPAAGSFADPRMQQALHFKALQEQALLINAQQQQYVDALAQLAMAQKQVDMVSATLMGSSPRVQPAAGNMGLNPFMASAAAARQQQPAPDLQALLMLQQLRGF